MGKPVHCCPKHQFPLDRKGEQCPICREEMEDEYGVAPDDDDDSQVSCPACDGTGDAPDNGTNMGECDKCCGTGILK